MAGTSQNPAGGGAAPPRANFFYIRKTVQGIARGRALSILDVGCGEGALLALLRQDGHDVHGYDLGYRRESALERLGEIVPDIEQRLRFTEDERCIPFESDRFDVVCSNQVLEHVKYLDCILGESARVLKPGGVHIATFPYATYPLEGHLRVPFAHWLPPGQARARYLAVFHFLRGKGRRSLELGRQGDEYLAKKTFYRFRNEFSALAGRYFESFESDAAAYIDAKLELMRARRGVAGVLALALGACRGRMMTSVVRNFVNEAALFSRPRKPADG